MNKNNFKSIFNKVHKDVFDYSQFVYINSKTKGEIICSKHGSFYQRPSEHAKGASCPKCSIVKRAASRKCKINDVMDRIYLVHDNTYDYSNFNFDKMTDKGEIVCKKHGSFLQSPKCHLRGQGCPKCVIRYGCINLFNKDKYKFFLNKPGKLYFLRLKSDKEDFYKIGISNDKNYKYRISSYKKNYDVEVINFIESDMAHLFTLEQLILNENKNLLYKPILNFAGKTECFVTNPYQLYVNLENNYYEWNQKRMENYENIE